MKARSLGILLGIALVLVALTALVLKSGEPEPESGRLAPALADRINDAASLRIRSGPREITLQRADEGWVVADRAGYPARFDKVREALVALAEARLVEPKTARPDRFADLWLDDPDAAEAKGVLVEVKDAAGETLAALILGKPANAPTGTQEGTFLRRAAENQTYISDLKARIDPAVTEWISRDLLTLDRARVRAAHVTRPDGGELRVRREAPTRADFTVENLPPGRELRYATAGAEPVNAIEFVTLADVAPLASIDFDGALVATTAYACFDGLVITVRLAKVDEKYWAHFAASADFSLRPPEPAEGEEPAFRPVKSPDEVEREVAELNARLGPWAFALDDYKARQFDKKLDDLLKEAPAAPPAPEGPPLPAPDPPEGPVPEIGDHTPSPLPPRDTGKPAAPPDDGDGP